MGTGKESRLCFAKIYNILYFNTYMTYMSDTAGYFGYGGHNMNMVGTRRTKSLSDMFIGVPKDSIQ